MQCDQQLHLLCHNEYISLQIASQNKPILKNNKTKQKKPQNSRKRVKGKKVVCCTHREALEKAGKLNTANHSKGRRYLAVLPECWGEM